MPALGGKRWIAGLLGAILLAHAAPGGATGRLCASTPPNTSAPCRIALLLPLQSDSLGQAAQALRDGFLAAASVDAQAPAISLIDSGDTPASAQDAYARAAAGHVLIVGPLGKSLVAALVASPVLTPTLALSLPNDSVLPSHMAAIGLSLDAEGRQLAQWAAARQRGPALIVTAGASWQQRLASVLAAQWQQGGRTASVLEAAAASGYLSDAALAAILARVASSRPALVFAALEPDQARQLKAALPPELPVYGASSVNPGPDAQLAPHELDGLHLLDLPWLLTPDTAGVAAWPQPLSPLPPDLARLYALGIDAYRVARALALNDGDGVELDGVTGKLSLHFGDGPARFARRAAAAVYQAGLAQPATEP
ncbi:penicillin-binding protein activator [Massilia sp. TS11]|uniref:penicillin-binding protein activator n=1 Tax=Massilia sp. TS11 TaxID=2908003 RepID=UPI001EDB6433|nr:penicillin-binding protein activator [Massilia sp. TS11]MCG2585177.1 penicillin-binding protein activator [Massilia sp. TS11]